MPFDCREYGCQAYSSRMPLSPNSPRLRGFALPAATTGRGRTRILEALAIAAVLLVVSPACAQQPGMLRLPREQWQMHVGDDPRCAEKAHNPACTGQKFFVDVNRYGV
jgi:hypothetical protein